MILNNGAVSPLTPRLVEVRSEGEDVILAIGGVTLRLGFELAFAVSDWIDSRARIAKASPSRSLFRAIGVLHDSADPKSRDLGQPSRPISLPPKRLREGDVRVEARPSSVPGADGVVILYSRGAEIAFPPSTAFSIAQWVRLRAKESKDRAGDSARPWRSIIDEKRERCGPDYTGG